MGMYTQFEIDITLKLHNCEKTKDLKQIIEGYKNYLEDDDLDEEWYVRFRNKWKKKYKLFESTRWQSIIANISCLAQKNESELKVYNHDEIDFKNYNNEIERFLYAFIKHSTIIIGYAKDQYEEDDNWTFYVTSGKKCLALNDITEV